jgi:ribonuclease D
MRTLSREAINELAIGRYVGEVVLVESAADMAGAAADFAQERLVGFDTETRPSFRPGESHPPALAQVATARAVYLFPLLRVDSSATLAALLSSGKTIKAGVGLADDVNALKRRFDFEPAAMVDLGAVARRHALEKSGVRALSAAFLGFRIPKGTKTSNWGASRLSAQQIAYAATDAWACRQLYLKFEELGLL